MSAENKVVADATTTTVGSCSIPLPNIITSNDGHEQEEWLEEDEDDCDRHTGRNNLTLNGGYVPTSSIDNANDTSRNSISVNSDSGSVDNTTAISSFQRIALTFSTQGLGFLSVPLLAYPLLELGCDADALWRVLLGVGALPGVVVLYLRLFSNSARDCKHTNEANNHEDGITEGDENSAVVDQDHIDYADSSAPKIQDGKVPTSSNATVNGGGNNFITSSTLFGDASSVEPHTGVILDERDNELALVEHSYTSSDNNMDNEKQAQRIRDELPDNPPIPPLRNRTPSL